MPNVGAGQPLPPSQYASEVALEVDRASVKRSRSVSALEREDEKLGGGTPVDGALTPEPGKAYRAPARPGAGRVEPEASKPRTARGAEAEAGPTERLMEARRARGDALFKAAIVADQNAKLSIFATRPAILSPVGGGGAVVDLARDGPSLCVYRSPASPGCAQPVTQATRQQCPTAHNPRRAGHPRRHSTHCARSCARPRSSSCTCC